MRTIKFRGHAISDSCGQSVDKIVHGDLIHEWNKVSIFDEDDGDIYEVDPESVVQLVGHDKHGKEVYEDDILLDDDEFINEWQAHLTWQVTDKDCADIECFYNLDELTLKE